MYSNTGRNYTSHMTLDIKTGFKAITIYARNTLKVRGKTFMVQLLEKPSAGFDFMSNIYTILSFMFALTLCCLCCVGCCKCFLIRGHVDFNVD